MPHPLTLLRPLPLFRPLRVLAAACTLAATACTGPASFGDDLTNPQLPARGTADIQDWLRAGYYQAWACEPAPHPGRTSSPHATNRICNNDALHAAAGTGAFPVGAAAVKELFSGGAITAYAVARKMTAGDGGDSWYWYEGPDTVYANGEGDSSCTGCHAEAPRDFVFTIVP